MAFKFMMKQLDLNITEIKTYFTNNLKIVKFVIKQSNFNVIGVKFNLRTT